MRGPIGLASLEKLKIECGPALFRGQAGDGGTKSTVRPRFSPVSTDRPTSSGIVTSRCRNF